jgi:3-hydroxyisobutyrate dehydrogenase
MMRVGFIGLGSQGGPMAQRIIDAGYPTTLWARRAATLEPYEGSAATFADSPAALAAASELIGVCVLGDADVEDVVTAMLPGVQEGTVVAVHSTVHPQTCVRLAQVVAARGATLIDAPVSGGGGAAASGALLVMVGGDAEPLERCRAVFETYGNPVVHMGPLGAGQVAKLVNNVLFVVNIATADDALALGESLGLDRSALAMVIGRGSGNSYSLAVVGNQGVESLGQVAGATLRKDVDIATSIATERDARTGSLLSIAEDLLARMGHPARR